MSLVDTDASTRLERLDSTVETLTASVVLPKLLKAEQLGFVLNVSETQVRRLDKAGLVPKPLKIGGSVRWDPEDIREWIQAGCPDRRRWLEV